MTIKEMDRNNLCGCEEAKPVIKHQEVFNGLNGVCKNCGHNIYYQGSKWEHFTRSYRPWGFPYTTQKCYADKQF